jgi:hypothetical protein
MSYCKKQPKQRLVEWKDQVENRRIPVECDSHGTRYSQGTRVVGVWY